MCSNLKNVTGLCSRKSCPLANSRYATVTEKDGVCYLQMKTVERAHSPKNLWEKVPLAANYETALAQISEQLEFWPGWLVHKCKQRYTKIFQYLMRMRKLELRRNAPRLLLPRNKKVERRDLVREDKAETAARIETAIKNELLERLKAGTYGDIYNFLPSTFGSLLDAEGQPHDEEEIDRLADADEIEEDTMQQVEQYIEDEDDFSADMEDFDVNAPNQHDDDDEDDLDDLEDEDDDGLDEDDDDDDDDDDEDDDEDDEPSQRSSSKKHKKVVPKVVPKRQKRHVEIEYEQAPRAVAAPLRTTNNKKK
jgi:protein MAK16